MVLGGGGNTGIAWETGLLWGLAEQGVDLTAADRVIGTSAGSVVGAQITGGDSLEQLYRRQLLSPAELGDGDIPVASISPLVVLRFGWYLLRSRGDLERFGRLLGRAAVLKAMGGGLPSVAERYEQIGQRIGGLTWPDRDLVVTAVDAVTGELVTYGPRGPEPEVSLEDAVNASCAVPLVYPPIRIGPRIVIDGGVRSGSNADLAAGCDVVVALTPVDRTIGPMRSAASMLADLDVPHLVITPDEGARFAIGKNVLDPSARPPAARAGYAQGRELADEVGELWARSATR